MNAAVEDFLQHVRHEKGQSVQTQKTYSALLNRFIRWAESRGLADWESVTRKHLTEFLKHERNRKPEGQAKDKAIQLSPESIYLQIAALRAFYKFAAEEEIIPANLAEYLSLPRRWKRLPKSLSDLEIEGREVAEKVRDLSLQIYTEAREYARERGIIIADTKFEFGKLDGELILIDEVLTPDSSRFWPLDEYEPGRGQHAYDKQFVRDYLETLDWDKTPPGPELPDDIVQKTSEKYIEAYTQITGLNF